MLPLSWAERHGALTHFPVALLVTAVAFEIGALVFKKAEWRTVSFWLLVGAVVLAVPSLPTGYLTAREVGYVTGGLLSPTARPSPVFQQHWIAALTTSTLAIILLAWRVKSHDRLTGSAFAASVVLALATGAAVVYTGYLGGKMVFGSQSQQESAYEPVEERQNGRLGLAKQSAQTPAVDPKLVQVGAKLFQNETNGCLGCHTMNGEGGKVGPNLTHEARRQAEIEWHIAHLKNPQEMQPGSAMPSYDKLRPEELKALAAYLSTRK